MRNLQTELPEHTFRLKTYKKNELAMPTLDKAMPAHDEGTPGDGVRQEPPVPAQGGGGGNSQTPGRTVLAGFTGCFFHCFSPV